MLSEFFFLLQATERLQEVEYEMMNKTIELEKQLSDTSTELEEIKVTRQGHNDT